MNNEPIKDDGGAAFPMHERDDALRGMSLRDYFAGQALTGYAAYHPASIMGPFIEKTAALAYQYADAMLKAREGKP